MRDILERLVKGEISLDEAEKLLRLNAIEEVGRIAKIDISREERKEVPEIILAEGKSVNDTLRIAEAFVEKKGRAIISRVDDKLFRIVKRRFRNGFNVTLNRDARVIIIKKEGYKVRETGGRVGIIAAGTADIPVAEEARIMAEEMGCEVITEYDVGVAGIHRLFPALKNMAEKDVDVIIVVAGREGALPSVVSSMVNVPVIAVPRSVGYGFGGHGIGALIAMLQSCSLGLAVVNIDGGTPAGIIAALISNRVAKWRNR
ncbi:MAG: nickel pincer cofactor biosynthesis protein LarB [Nitrososphaerota archaeon]|nr:nickel pincer cofactor biosynthesis protein LarB [Nitrososphaerales archaeon]MDW8045066.1 nickel pincer cofactor biosynthesis protein LarB [Nitrososphaerota archaeon]